ncbi:hypothetical protein DWB77_01065 [Streptomyces hundungensis]|uniref:Uncharacterized protein n=1 Tax=Streptomyces hundungensis TaxID=1077946 RepID=A0A387H5E3_9ACTN|nr:hypothetical protein [Streptomyces hundungensis]AYG78956.1 hypothetical protein DWB77_01065 [Streptomyces hundungensis]
MEWQSDEFGASHAGRAGAVLADGSEPEPLYFDASSGSFGYTSSDWWLYDGTLHAPLATHLRGVCACGWRGSALYPVDWTQVDDERPYDTVVPGPYADWQNHIQHVEARTVPVPVELDDLVGQLDARLSVLADDAPLAALRVVAALERLTGRIGMVAAFHTRADEVSWESVGQALGLTEQEARSRVASYRYRS